MYDLRVSQSAMQVRRLGRFNQDEEERGVVYLIMDRATGFNAQLRSSSYYYNNYIGISY